MRDPKWDTSRSAEKDKSADVTGAPAPIGNRASVHADHMLASDENREPSPDARRVLHSHGSESDGGAREDCCVSS